MRLCRRLVTFYICLECGKWARERWELEEFRNRWGRTDHFENVREQLVLWVFTYGECESKTKKVSVWRHVHCIFSNSERHNEVKKVLLCYWSLRSSIFPLQTVESELWHTKGYSVLNTLSRLVYWHTQSCATSLEKQGKLMEGLCRRCVDQIHSIFFKSD